jgi:hypothetical protein
MTEVGMRIGSLLLVIWLVIGGLAAGQRGDYKRFIGSCSRAGTIAVTVLAGPLNYVGVNPNINCTAPRSSRVARVARHAGTRRLALQRQSKSAVDQLGR